MPKEAHQSGTFQIELEFRSVGFWGEGKTGVPGEKPLGARTRTNNKLPVMMRRKCQTFDPEKVGRYKITKSERGFHGQ